MSHCQRCGKRPAIIRHRSTLEGQSQLGEYCAHCAALLESRHLLGELIPERDHPRWRGSDPVEALTDEAQHVLEDAVKLTLSWGFDRLKSEFVLLALARCDHPVSRRLSEAGLTPRRIEQRLESLLQRGEALSGHKASLTPRVKHILVLAFQEALTQEQRLIAPEHLLTGILSERQNLAAWLLQQAGFGGDLQEPLVVEEPMLERFARDLTEQARSKQLTHVIGREAEITRIIQALYRGSSTILIAEAGAGKAAIAEGLAQRIAEGEVPARLAAKRLLEIDLDALRDTAEEGAFEALLGEASRQKDRIILVMDDLPAILEDREACRILGGALRRGDLQVLGTGTLEGYHRLAHDLELGEAFQPFLLSEATPEETLEMLHELRPALEARHRVKIHELALIAAVELSDHYVHDHPLPDKAIDLLDEAASMVRVDHPLQSEDLAHLDAARHELTEALRQALDDERMEVAAEVRAQVRAVQEKLMQRRSDLRALHGAHDPEVGAEMVARVLSGWTGIPVAKLLLEESARREEMEGMLRKHIIGQEEALRAVAEAVRLAGTGLKDPDRPIASLLLAGPDAPGKVETAQAIAEFLFDDEAALTRCDMTDFTDECDLKRLLGAPRGEADTPAPLAQAMRRHPHAVILFENIERAHFECFQALLEVLDEGRLLDARGRTIDLHHAVVLMTTGLSVEDATGMEAITRETLHRLRERFKPEFLNRFDEIVIFHPLSQDELGLMLEPMLAHTRRQLRSQGMELDLSEEARERLLLEGTAPRLRRAVKRFIEAPVNRLLLQEEDLHGARLRIDARSDAGLELRIDRHSAGVSV